MEKKKYSIFIVDDHPMMRDGISQVINQQPDLEVIAEASSGPEALDKLSDISPEIALVDISLKGMNGIELTREIRKRFKNLPVLILSMHPEKYYAERAVKAGAKGYIMKHETSDKVLKAIRRVLEGKFYLSEDISEKIISRMSGNISQSGTSVDKLSNREFEAFRYVGSGLKPQQIAEKLFVSVKTVETYYSRIKEKLSLKSASELRQFAVNWFKEDSK